MPNIEPSPPSLAAPASSGDGSGLALTALATKRSTAEPHKDSFEITVSSAKSDAPQLVLCVCPSDTIDYVRRMIFAQTGVLPDDQHIRLDGRSFDSSKTLAECNASASTHLTLTFSSPAAEATFTPPSHTIRDGIAHELFTPPLAPLPISAQTSLAPSATTEAAVPLAAQSEPVLSIPTLPAWTSEAEPGTIKKAGLTFTRRGSIKKPVKQAAEPSSSGGSAGQLPRPSSRRFSFSIGSIFRRGSDRKAPVLQKESEAEKHDLFPRARARVLHEWDGIIPTLPGQKGPVPKGLKLHLDRPVTIGRVVNQDWYQGADPHGHFGYFARNYVQVIEVMDPTILPELGSDAPPSQPDAPGSNPQAPRSPSPFPDRSGSRAAYDETFSQTRVSVLFTSKPVLVSPFPISVTLTLLAAPVTRISSVTFRASFPDGSILSLTPVAITSDKTDVHHVDGKTHEIDLSVGTPSTTPATGSATWKNSGNKQADYQRSTWGRIEGTGVGTATASWVFEEDPGKAGRHGVPIVKTTQELDLGLDVRPVRCDYIVDVTVVEGDGARAGFFNSKTYRSGKQEIFLP